MMDGMSYDQDVVDTTMQPAPPIDESFQEGGYSGLGAEVAEHMMRNRLDGSRHPRQQLGTTDESRLGKFPFERE
jgi:hypothetical protein